MKQQTEYTCGPACLRYWMHMKGLAVPSEESIASAFNTTETDGTTPQDFIAGLSAFALSGEILQTNNYCAGDIILIQEADYGHWVVVLENVREYWDAWDGAMKPLSAIDTKALVADQWLNDIVLRLRVDFTK